MNKVAVQGTAIIYLILFYHLCLPREEALLLEHFGDQYQYYMKTTPRLIPVLSEKKHQ